MIVYILLCDSKLPILGGEFNSKGTFLAAYSNMFTAQRAITEYWLPPNLVRLATQEEQKYCPRNAICNQVYVDRSQNFLYNFYILSIDLDKNKDD